MCLLCLDVAMSGDRRVGVGSVVCCGSLLAQCLRNRRFEGVSWRSVQRDPEEIHMYHSTS
eukprot:8779739-Prorocentrum_lima.AAC.1